MPDYRYPLASIYDRLFPPPDVPDERTFEDVAWESGGYTGEPIPGRQDLSIIADLLSRLPAIPSGVGIEGYQGYTAPETPAPGTIEREPREVGLAGVIDQAQESFGPGYKTVPGIQAFTGGPGRYRVETGPYFQNRSVEGLQADKAANSLRAFTTAKYGGPGRYGGAASYMNPVEEAGEARLRTATTLARHRPNLPVDDIFKQIVELPTMELQAQLAGPLKELAAIGEQERQRRENAWLAQATSGGRLGAMPSEGLSTEGLKRIQQIITGSRADERLENEQARLAESERRGRMTGPSRSDIITRAQRILLESGRTVKKTPDGDLVVYQQNKPVKDGEKLLANALKEAERQLRSGAP